MPNLEHAAVAGWLAELRPDSEAAAWPPALRPVETEAGVPASLEALGLTLGELEAGGLPNLSGVLRSAPLRGEMQAVMAQLGAARTLRLLHWMAEVDLPDCHDVIAALVQDDTPAARSLRATVGAVTRQATVRRMFAPERVAALERACNDMMEDAQ